MSAIKPIIREVKQAVLSGMAHSKDKLHQLTDNMLNHVDDVSKRVRGQDRFEGRDAPWALRGGWDRNSSTQPGDYTPGGRYDHDHKSDRPDPEDYLSKDYIDRHLARFDNGASRIYVSDSLNSYGPAQADHDAFVFPTEDLDRVLNEAGHDTDKLEDLLGFDRGSLRDDAGNPLQIEIRHFSPDELNGLTVPSGRENGANENWLPGGYLPTGVPEGVITMPDTATGSRNGGGGPASWPGTFGGNYELR